MTKRGPRHHLLDIYGSTLHVATTRKQWRTLHKLIDSLDEDPDGLGFTSSDVHESAVNHHHVSVFIDVKAHEGDLESLVETCAHEATHAASMVFDHIGYQHGTWDHETHAYFVGWVSRWLYSAAKA